MRKIIFNPGVSALLLKNCQWLCKSKPLQMMLNSMTQKDILPEISPADGDPTDVVLQRVGERIEHDEIINNEPNGESDPTVVM